MSAMLTKAPSQVNTDAISGVVVNQYVVPAPKDRPALAPRTAYLIASGDLREQANRAGWASQQELEAIVEKALARNGWTLARAHAEDPITGHGFISSQRMGMDVFLNIPVDAPLIVAEAVWPMFK